MSKNFPVFRINNFVDYNQCQHFGDSFYIRKFHQHICENCFLDKPHGHDFYIVLLITQGRGQHIIDSKTYEVAPRVLFFVNPGQVHAWDLSEDIDGYILFFTKEYLLVEFHHNQLSKLPFFHTRILEPFMKLNQPETEEIHRAFHEIDLEYLAGNQYCHDLIRLGLKSLLLKIERKYARGSSGRKKLYQENLFTKFEVLVDQHFKDHRTVSDYAEMMNLSLKQLNSLCRKLINKTPGDIIQNRIILEAKRLLMHSDAPVFSIAETLNYHDGSYFIRLFKKATQMTPEKFRTQAILNKVA